MSAEIERREARLIEMRAKAAQLRRDLAEELYLIKQEESTITWLKARQAERATK